MGFLFVSHIFAAEECAISDGPAPVLATYVDVSEWLLAKISDEAGKYTCKSDASGKNSATDTIDKATSSFVGSMNGALDFSNFFTSGRFYIDMVLKSEIPPGIKRDHEHLGYTIDRIKDVYQATYSRCAAEKVLESNLSDDASYATKGKTIGSVLDDLLVNQTHMLNYYRETVLGDATADSYSFILVGDNNQFRADMQQSYGPKAFENCNKKSEYFKQTKEAIDRITHLGGGIEQGMKEWEDAWRLLNSNPSDAKYAETERELLQGELSTQGMSAKWSAAIMNNLANYNSQNAHEGISGFVGSIGERVYASVNQFGKAYDEIKQSLSRPQTTDQYVKTYQNFQVVKNDTFDELKADYIRAKDLVGSENQVMDTNVANLISTHITLEQTNKAIRPYVKLSEKTCKDQGSNLPANCTY